VRGKSTGGVTPWVPEVKAAGGDFTRNRGHPTLMPPSRKRGLKRQWGMEMDPCLGRQTNPLLASLTSQLPLSNQYGALGCEGQANKHASEGPSRGLPSTSQSAPRILTAPVKKKWRVIVTGDSLLQGIEGPKCRPDPSHR